MKIVCIEPNNPHTGEVLESYKENDLWYEVVENGRHYLCAKKFWKPLEEK